MATPEEITLRIEAADAELQRLEDTCAAAELRLAVIGIDADRMREEIKQVLHALRSLRSVILVLLDDTEPPKPKGSKAS